MNSPDFGVSAMIPEIPDFICLMRFEGKLFVSLYFFMTASASEKLELSGQVGPDAITSIGSPTTSESIRLTVVAG